MSYAWIVSFVPGLRLSGSSEQLSDGVGRQFWGPRLRVSLRDGRRPYRRKAFLALSIVCLDGTVDLVWIQPRWSRPVLVCMHSYHAAYDV